MAYKVVLLVTVVPSVKEMERSESVYQPANSWPPVSSGTIAGISAPAGNLQVMVVVIINHIVHSVDYGVRVTKDKHYFFVIHIDQNISGLTASAKSSSRQLNILIHQIPGQGLQGQAHGILKAASPDVALSLFQGQCELVSADIHVAHGQVEFQSDRTNADFLHIEIPIAGCGGG